MSVQPIPVYSGCEAGEGRKTIPFPANFTTGAPSVSLDLQTLQESGRFSGIQSLYVDNSQNAVEVDILLSVTNQRIIVAPKTQGYYIALSVNSNCNIMFTCAANIVVNIFLMNFMVAPATWTVQ